MLNVRNSTKGLNYITKSSNKKEKPLESHSNALSSKTKVEFLIVIQFDIVCGKYIYIYIYIYLCIGYLRYVAEIITANNFKLNNY